MAKLKIKKSKRPYQPLVLAILDGWGVSPETKGNPEAQAKTPVFDALYKKYQINF
jgi:bisphosphoglycerate-independent phosphoglycerate mutase (AlkP superfamily)